MSNVTREEVLAKKINDKIILEMEGSLGKSGEVIGIIIDTALEEMDIRQTDDDKTFDNIEMVTFTKNILQQARKFISTMEYDEIFELNQQPQLSDDVEMQLQHLENTLESIEWWSDYDCVNEIRQHIQAQANEIDNKQKAFEHMKLISQEHLDKLNAIKETILTGDELKVLRNILDFTSPIVDKLVKQTTLFKEER